jgi:hypothetical protein
MVPLPRFAGEEKKPVAEVLAKVPAQGRLANAGITINGGTPAAVWAAIARGEVVLALGVIGVVVLLILTAAVLILMTALLIRRPLDFTAFPTVLLVTTLFRLGLDVAGTRLVLAHGHEGGDPAGHIIQGFSNLMTGGNFIIGVIVFFILVVVNFVVITKGSTRIAEVAARFTLDAMPGKQMASAGRTWSRRAPSSGPWTAPPSSCAATRSPASSSCSSTSSAAC